MVAWSDAPSPDRPRPPRPRPRGPGRGRRSRHTRGRAGADRDLPARIALFSCRPPRPGRMDLAYRPPSGCEGRPCPSGVPAPRPGRVGLSGRVGPRGGLPRRPPRGPVPAPLGPRRARRLGVGGLGEARSDLPRPRPATVGSAVGWQARSPVSVDASPAHAIGHAGYMQNLAYFPHIHCISGGRVAYLPDRWVGLATWSAPTPRATSPPRT